MFWIEAWELPLCNGLLGVIPVDTLVEIRCLHAGGYDTWDL